jgi:hypothetical protein
MLMGKRGFVDWFKCDRVGQSLGPDLIQLVHVQIVTRHLQDCQKAVSDRLGCPNTRFTGIFGKDWVSTIPGLNELTITFLSPSALASLPCRARAMFISK